MRQGTQQPRSGVVLNRLPRQDSGGYGTYAYDYSGDSPRASAKRQTHDSPAREARV